VQAVAPTPPASGFKQASGELVTPIGSVVVPTPANGLVSGIPNNVPTVEQRPAPIAPVTTNQPQVGGIQRQFLNTTRASLDYRIDQVGPSGVGKVEVWISADQGAAWKRLGEDADRRSPAEFDLPGDGLYGVRVVVANGNGFGGKPPVAGEQPQLWIDVDTMAPIAQLKEVEPIANGGTLDIRWTVTDKNLGPEPINLYYATRREGPWQPVARGLKNDGLFRWAFPRDAGSQFFVRLEVSDQAGNLARCEAVNAVVLDMTEPRSSVVGVTGVQVGKQ
jgi:hypothetical protein